MRGHRGIDVAIGFGELVEVLVEGARQFVAAAGEVFEMLVDHRIDQGSRVGEF